MKQTSLDIIGLACRYPGSIESPARLWQVLQGKESMVGAPPGSRWRRSAAVSPSYVKGTSVTSRAGWLSRIDTFDAGYFHVSPNEAADLDVQQRLALEVAIEALIDANIAPKSLAGRSVGVFVGAGMAEQMGRTFADPDTMSMHSVAGAALSIIANRISYFLDLEGPSLTVDTACSSSLTALYIAHRALQAGDCELALVIGVNALLGDAPFVGFSQAHMLSPRGVSAPFDDSADGFVRAEGCGACVLELAGSAPTGSRRVYARILGTGANEDGRTPSMTMPSGQRQRELMQRVAEQAGVRPGSVTFVEAHGTGTPVGDPIEATSICEVFGQDRRAPLPISSVKGHLGHMETAAGLCGLTKAALSIYHRQLLPTAGHQQLTRKLDAQALNFRIVVEPEPISQSEPIIAGVSSYGFGGANAFALLGEAAPSLRVDPQPAHGAFSGNVLLPMSSHQRAGLDQLEAEATQIAPAELVEAAAWWGRVHTAERERRVLFGQVSASFVAGASRFEGTAPAVAPRLLFGFGGQGSHSARMGSQLYARSELFQQLMHELDACYERVSGVSLLRQHGFCRAELAPALLDDVGLTLPCIVLSQVAQVQLLEALGVRPSAVLGHSTGEMVAAWCAGALSLEELCFVTHQRASHQARMRRGAMGALGVGATAASSLVEELGLGGQVVLAAINAEDAVTLAGDVEALAQVVSAAKARGFRATKLDIPRAYHSHHVAEIMGSLREQLAGLSARATRLPFVSSVAGLSGLRDGSELHGEYWLSNIERPVHFQQACAAASGLTDLVLEVSPRPVLAGYLAQNLADREVLTTLPREQPEDVGLQQALARLYVAGVDLDWQALQPPRRFVSVPALPWDHSRPVVDNPARERNLAAVKREPGAVSLRRDEHALFEGHRVEGRPVLPGASYVTRALATLETATLRDVAFTKFLPLWVESEATELRLERTAGGGRWASDAGAHMTFRLGAETASAGASYATEALEQIRARCPDQLEMRRIYAMLNALSGLELSGVFESLSAARLGDGEALAEAELPSGLEAVDAEAVVLDAGFQLLGFMAGLDVDFWAPTSAERVTRLCATPSRAYWHARLRSLDGRKVVGDLCLRDAQGEPVLVVEGFALSKVPSSAGEPQLLCVRWQELGLPTAARKAAAAGVASLGRVLELCAGSVLRVLDLTGHCLVSALDTLPESARPLLHAVTLGGAAAAHVRPVAALSEIGSDTFDLVIGAGAECFCTPGGLLMAADWQRPSDFPTATPREKPLGWASFGDYYAPGVGVAVPLAEAELVVDSRDSLLQASQLLRSAPPAARIVFIVRESSDQMPSGLLGLARAARAESSRDVRVISVPRQLDVSQARLVLDPLLERGLGSERELCLRDGLLLVPRLVPAPALSPPRPGPERRLEARQPGQLSSLAWRPIAADNEQLRPHEVRLRVHDVALHFKDVMLALGLLPGFLPVLGLEASATILELGAAVQQAYPELRAGQEVLCCRLAEARSARQGLLGSIALLDAACCIPLPSGLPRREAAGFLGAFMTAWYGLSHAARLCAGETVLVHSAAGGVGQAAVQIARRRGARVIASVGSPEKREYLRQRYGVSDFIDSHRPEQFVEEIKQLTQGRGVDVVLNSLAGEGLLQSLRCLAPGGRHVEIGKRDILEHTALDMSLLKENVSFLSVHLDLLGTREPAKLRALMCECAALLAGGEAELLPTTAYPASEVEQVFRLMSSGRHTGRLLISFDQASDAGLPLGDAWPEALFAGGETQLITGGTRGAGLALAGLLAERGAGRILLLGRQSVLSRRSQLELAGLRTRFVDTSFEPVALDLADAGALAELFEQEPTITGIFHAATDYREQRADALEAADLDTWEIKVGAAWRLHQLSLGRALPLRQFVLFGSLAGLYGNAGQAAYVAANAALHELIRQRHALGLVGHAIDLPVLLGAGRLSDPRYVRELELSTSWLNPVSFQRVGRELLQRIASSEVTQGLVIDGPTKPSFHAHVEFRALFEHLHEPSVAPEVAVSSDDLASLVGQLRAKAAQLLGGKDADVDPERPLTALGLDSLAAVELSTWVKKSLQAEVSQAELLTGLSIAALAERVAGVPRSARANSTTTTPRTTAPEPPRLAASLPRPASQPAAASPRPTTEPTELASASALRTPRAPLELAQRPQLSSSHELVELPSALNGTELERLLMRVRAANGVLLLRRQSATSAFCLGMDLSEQSFADPSLAEGLERFAELSEALQQLAMPSICVVDGACRGGGMLFPALSSYVLAVEGASFGFPEVRRGGLPGVVSVAAQRRLSKAQCERFMLTGDSFDARRALELGFVDFVGTAEQVEQEVSRVLGRFEAIGAPLLASAKTSCPAGSTAQALIAMGGLAVQPAPPPDQARAEVKLDDASNGHVAILELSNPRESNAMDRALAADMARSVALLKQRPALRAVVFQGSGKHFCVGANPHTFGREAAALTLTAAAAVVYELYAAFVALREVQAAIVCAVHGHVVGGGLAAMLNADYRICAADTSFNVGNLPRGVCPGLLLSQNLGATVGAAWASDLYLNDYALNAEQALALGLVHEVARDADDAQARALEMARRLAEAPALGVQNTLKLLRGPIDWARLAEESLGIARCMRGGQAFSAMRKPAQPLLKAATSRLAALPAPASSAVPGATAAPASKSRAQNVGIHALELYFPNHRADQQQLEDYDGVPGKYTVGLGQVEVTFGADDEDAVSMALSAVSRLMKRHGIAWTEIGRLEVGTESSSDRSKSVKSHLMQLFEAHGATDVEGIDTYHACYGGTAAFFNTVAWCQGEAWDGRYGLVVCVDLAETDGKHRFLQGAAAVAMLVGADGALVLEPERGTKSLHTWDFYKPVGWSEPFPVMPDGAATIDVYMSCLDGAQQSLAKKTGDLGLLGSTDYFVFHCTSVYLCKRAFQRLAQNEDPTLALRAIQDLYEAKVQPSTLFTQHVGTMYTASCYAALCSLVFTQGEALVGKRIAMFSFGSGAIGSLFSLRVARAPGFAPDLQRRLDARILHSPEVFTRRSHAYTKTYARFDFAPEHVEGQQPDAYYLARVELDGRRRYRLGAAEGVRKLPPLPRLPLPSLGDTLARLQALALGLLQPAEQIRLGAACASLAAGAGPTLQRELEQRAEDGDTSYVFQLWFDKYLQNRAPLVYQGGAGYVAGLSLGHDPLEVAARIAHGIGVTQLKLRRGGVAPQQMGTRPLCMQLVANVLGYTRLPRPGRDEPKRTPNAEHVVVALGGDFYQLGVIAEGQARSASELLAELRALVRPDTSLALGRLTSLPRERWAAARESLRELPSNARALDSIESALCLVCLEDGAPQGDAERLGHVLTAGLSNRWFDKSLQLVVFPDGGLGAYMEHSGFDATHLALVYGQVLAAAVTCETIGSGAPVARLAPLAFALSSEVEAALAEADVELGRVAATFTLRQLTRRAFGRPQLLARGVHPDVFVQLALQLAYYRLRGEHAIAYQPVQTRHYHYGRTEALRPATAEMLAFVRAFEVGESPGTLAALLRLASESLLSQQQRCLLGEGVDRHLLALRAAAAARGEVLELFEQPELAKVIGPAPLCTSTTEVAADVGTPLPAFFPETPGGYGVAYLALERGLTVLTTSARADAEPFQAALSRALDDLGAYLLPEEQQPQHARAETGALL